MLISLSERVNRELGLGLQNIMRNVSTTSRTAKELLSFNENVDQKTPGRKQGLPEISFNLHKGNQWILTEKRLALSLFHYVEKARRSQDFRTTLSSINFCYIIYFVEVVRSFEVVHWDNLPLIATLSVV